MNIEKALEQEKGRILRPEHVIEAMQICYALANYGPESPLQDKVNLINAAQSLMKKMEEAEKRHLKKLAKEEAKRQTLMTLSMNRGQA
jgi:mannose/cellobiose epimerase-like protein (N-acyl-D-glucosamine 2-epimerase family)